jgi:hypothetical protein
MGSRDCATGSEVPACQMVCGGIQQRRSTRIMKRRPVLILPGGGWLLAAVACSVASPAAAQPAYRVSARQLQQVRDQRFPLRYPVPGVLELRVEAPRLRLLPEENRIATGLVIDASGPALRRSYSGDVDVDFALRYERSDMSLRAHQIRIQAVRLPALAPNAAALIDAYARAATQRALLEVVLHTLRPQDLALAETMGLEPGPITVTADGLVIGFVPREPR